MKFIKLSIKDKEVGLGPKLPNCPLLGGGGGWGRLRIPSFLDLALRFFFVGSWGSQLLCKPFFRFFMDQKKTRKPRTFSGGGGGGRRIKLYTDNIKYYCNLKS